MRIALTSITYEGIMRCSSELMISLKKQNYDVFIVAPTLRDISDSKELGINYIPIKIEAHGTNPLQEIELIKQYIKIYKEIKPDLVLSYTIKPDIYSGIACTMLKIPYISTINGIGDGIYNKGILRYIILTLLKIGLKNSRNVVFQNRRNKELFLTYKIVPLDKAVLVPGSGINIKLHPYEEFPKNDSVIIFTFIGRVSRDKGINEFIEAIKLLKKKYQNIQFNVVGACSKGYNDIVRNASNKGYIRYLGKVEPGEIHKILAASHAVILPSYHEGIPNVLLEGGAAGRPILTTFAEGCEDTFVDGVSGIGFEPKDINTLVDAIERFIAMPNKAREIMGKEAHKKIVTEFNRNIVDAIYLKLIKEVECS